VSDTVTRPAPPESDEGRPFWDATRQQRLVLPWCTECNAAFWFPRAACPRCLSTSIEWRPASGQGTVHAASAQHVAAIPELADRVPYAVALVDLDEGVRLMSNVIGCPADEVRGGLAVRVTWEPLADGRHLPQFEPIPGGPS
jgi:uncharacterized OB-fold protein